MNKKIICTFLAVLAVLSGSASLTAVSAETTGAYESVFTDISSSDWFYNDVMEAYTLGLISGKNADTFAPDKNLTIAETIKLASTVHQYLTAGKINENAFVSASGTNWYDGYVSYAYKNDENILTMQKIINQL